MFNTHLMIRADNRPLQEAPHALNAIGVNVANNPFLFRMINPFVLRVGIFDAPISRHFIGVDRLRVWCGVIVNELVKHGLSGVGSDWHPNLSPAWDGSDVA